MNAMYPHKIDRLRVMHFLLLAWRKSLLHENPEAFPQVTQKFLANRADYESGSIISEIERLPQLEKVALEKEEPVPRSTLIHVLTLGMERCRKDIDVILWMYEGENFKPLQPEEV